MRTTIKQLGGNCCIASEVLIRFADDVSQVCIGRLHRGIVVRGLAYIYASVSPGNMEAI
jgi:hypothetical protein